MLKTTFSKSEPKLATCRDCQKFSLENSKTNLDSACDTFQLIEENLNLNNNAPPKKSHPE